MCWLVFCFIIGVSVVGSVPLSENGSIFVPNDDDGRIVGGVPADIKDFPYQLYLREATARGAVCGASIIGRNWGLTAAHCIEKLSGNIVLVAGTSSQSRGGSVHNVERRISHPSYSRGTMQFDIALLKVRQPFELRTVGVNCISLATQPTAPGTRAVASGWGTTREWGTQPDQLQKVVLPVISNQECQQKVNLPGITITESMICAGYKEGGKDTCQGDSGGPLVVQNKLIGVVSFGEGCARPNNPGVYANVFTLRNWIINHTGRLEC